MHYTFNQLQIFLVVSRLKSVTKAAEALNLTQPAVSIQLKNFQNQFDIPLTEVIGRNLFITEFGREIAQAAEQILDQVNAIQHKNLAYLGQLTGSLKLTVVSTGKYVMPYFLSDFLRLHQGIELVMDVTNKARVVASLQNNEVDFSLVSILPDKLQIDHLPLLQNKLFLVGNADSSHSGEGLIEHSALEDLPLIYREPGSGTRQTMERYLENAQLKARKRMELTSNEAVKQAVLAGLGYSIMPLIGIKNELLNGTLKILPIKGLPIRTEWSLVWLKEKKLSPVAKAYLEFLKLERANLISKHFEWFQMY
ncbi:LysR family transcriptional regulator [Dyadobacter crusticola]|uniref:LysR family transcriptional regulator n=1 Tax=Dyadobacter crusticola TaxID=292407 RepID=UPI0004E1CC33|nr:LysR family transcriptional regulator [Dyadobacter crusticola]